MGSGHREVQCWVREWLVDVGGHVIRQVWRINLAASSCL